MEKTTTLNLRVNSNLKANAQQILNKLGIPMSTAIDIYLNQIVLVGGIPFSVTLPNFDASKMSKEQLSSKLKEGYDDYLNNDVEDATAFFEDFKNKNVNENI